MAREAIAKSPSGRVKRTRVGQRNVLSVSNQDPNYVYRVVRNEGDRIEVFKEAGYETVDASTHRVGDRRTDSAANSGSIATAHLGGGLQGVVMRIPREYYNEDQDAKEAYNREVETGMKSENQTEFYGTIQTAVKDTA